MLRIVNNYVDKYFEDEVLKLVPLKERKWDNRNQVLRFGSSIPYPDNIVSDKIPDIFKTIKDIEFNSVTINEYLSGQHIPYHIDRADAGEEINVISLLSNAEIRFKRGVDVIIYKVPRYSLMSFKGDLRWKYKHYLKADEQRYSVVLRNTLNSQLKI